MTELQAICNRKCYNGFCDVICLIQHCFCSDRMCPLAASLAIGAGFNPIHLLLQLVWQKASISSAIPSTTPPMAISIFFKLAVSILNMFQDRNYIRYTKACHFNYHWSNFDRFSLNSNEGKRL